MFKMFLYSVLFTLILSADSIGTVTYRDIEGELVQVHVVYRHGHREPRAFYPHDPHALSSIWTNGPTQLTILGRQQAYRLGQHLRSRYRSLLPKVRAWKVVKATSSDTSRTLMTTAAVLAGLIPPYNDDIWSNITWQPAAIHTSPSNIDNVLGSRPQCPRYNQLLNSLPEDSSDSLRMLYYLLSKYTGKDVKTPNSLVNLYTCLDIESQAGLKLPNWTKPIYATMMNHTTRAFLRSIQTLEMKKLRSGPLIKKLISFHKSKTYNIHLYCTHDSVLTGLIGSLGFELKEPPSFTSALIVEYREYAGEINALFWYRKGPEGNLKQLKMPGCSSPCSLSELQALVEPLIPVDWTEDCIVKVYNSNVESGLKTVFASITLIVLFGWCVLHKYSKGYEEI